MIFSAGCFVAVACLTRIVQASFKIKVLKSSSKDDH
jgi:hypothetical protein